MAQGTIQQELNRAQSEPLLPIEKKLIRLEPRHRDRASRRAGAVQSFRGRDILRNLVARAPAARCMAGASEHAIAG